MKRQSVYPFLALLFLSSVLLSCKKEQPELRSLEEDCGCAKEVSADFTMEEMSSANEQFAKYTSTDSIFSNKNVRFTATETDAEYTWYIGSEIIHEKSVTRFFSDQLVGQSIPISLVVKKKGNAICLPNDDGYDSITKILYVTPYIIETSNDFDYGSIEGIYRVKSDHLADSFDIEVSVSKNSPVEPMLNLMNYDGLGSNCLNSARVTDANYRQLFSNTGTSVAVCEYLRGDIHNRLDGKVEMNFTFYYETHPDYKIRKYLGRKL